ncbi:MAG: ABC transporter substrate-binding protein [Phycisphaerae bacterium]|nr:ABC transporter substrate-binding protein [Phycisphaerae bacterium]
MKKRTDFLLLLMMLSALSLTPSVVARDAIHVGCPLPLTTSYGENSLRGLTLAMEEINDQGGITLQGKKLPIRLDIVETNDLDPKVSQASVLDKVKSLIHDKHVDILIGGPARSETNLDLMDIIAENNVVHILSTGCYTPKWNMGKFASDPKKYRKSFRMSGDVAWYIKEVKDILAELKKQYGFSKMFILIQDIQMSRAAADIVKKLAQGDGWQIVGEEAVASGTTDFSEPLKKCKASGAQLLFLWTWSQTAQMFQQWRDMEIPALPLGFVEVAEDPQFWRKTRGKCAYSVICLSEAGVTISDVTPLSRNFYNAYLDRWSVAPRSTASAACYEALYLLKDAVERADSLEPDKLIPALEKTDLPVVRGRLRFDKNHQCVFGYDPKTTVLGNWAQWQEGQRVTIWPAAAKTGDLKMPPWLQWTWSKKDEKK